MKTITLITLLFVSIYCRGKVYMCHDDDFKDEQCMKKETLGTNTFYWVRKCKGAKVCVDLPYYGGVIGACSIKVRSHYDGEVCANGNKCTSGICDGTKCKGLNPDIECEPQLNQCKKGYVCRSTADKDGYSTGSAYTCQKPIDNGKYCEYFSGFSETILTSQYQPGNEVIFPNSVYTSFNPAFFNPGLNPCGMNDVCSRTKDSPSYGKCVKIGSISNDEVASNPLACSSGYIESGKCKTGPDNVSGSSLRTSRGGVFAKYSNITDEFGKWKKEWDKKDIKEEDANYAYRYTKNKKSINEAFFRYTHAPFVGDADECAFDYMWKQNSSNSLKFSLMILVLALLF